jgi:hypothetical protein
VARTQNWSDQDRSRGAGPFAGPLVLRSCDGVLKSSLSVLVVGPTAPWLLEQIAGLSGSLDVLVRSWPDAQEWTRASTVRPVRISAAGSRTSPTSPTGTDRGAGAGRHPAALHPRQRDDELGATVHGCAA